MKHYFKNYTRLKKFTQLSISYRSPAYSRDEVNALVNLVAKYKHIILNKCTNSATNHAKEFAWAEISKDINKRGFKHRRHVDSLKTKWENLKKEARKASKNLVYLKKSDDNDVLYQIIEMVSENANINELRQSLLEDINGNLPVFYLFEISIFLFIAQCAYNYNYKYSSNRCTHYVRVCL